LLYANYSEGFRSGGFNGRGSSPSSVGPYDPETVENVEFGVKTTLLDNRFPANLAAFFMKYRNKQEDVVFPDPLSGTVTVVQNAANARLNGFEAELRAIPVDGLTVGFNFGYLHSRYDNWDDFGTLLDGPAAGQLAPIDKSGFLLRRAPRITGEFSLDYQRPLSDRVTLLLNGNYAFKSSYAIVANTVTITDPNPGLIDDFGLLNGSIGVEIGNLRVSGFARNLTNANYFLHVLDVGTTFGRTAASPEPIPTFGLWSFGTINAPRTFGVDILFRF
jgi:iron complex outermembrane receptor protein